MSTHQQLIALKEELETQLEVVQEAISAYTKDDLFISSLIIEDIINEKEILKVKLETIYRMIKS